MTYYDSIWVVESFCLISPIHQRPTCYHRQQKYLKRTFDLASVSDEGHNNPNPIFPKSTPPPSQVTEEGGPQQEEEVEGQANTRFSKFAPDINLETDDFRSQLKDNMKADLERRRRNDPNRGNQPAKTYLDNL